jgi:hypothetical protein
MASLASPKEFLSALWGDTKGWVELLTISKNKLILSYPFTYPDSVDSLLNAAPNHNRGANVYVGICLKREKWPRPSGFTAPDGKAEMEKRGTEANALASWAVWFEADFEGDGHKGKVIPAELCRKLIKEFRFPPSIIVRSGGGIQGYYLLKEPAQGNDLWRVKAINKALVNYYTVGHQGADPQSVDLARVFRLPGLMNLKYDPPRPVEISCWHPERRYDLMDFENLLPVGEPERPQTPPQRASTASLSGSGNEGGNGNGNGNGGTREVPSKEINEQTVEMLGELFSQLWFEGHRHAMALRVAGMLAFTGVRLEDARAIVRRASDRHGGDTEKRVKDVEDTYRNFVMGKEIVGGPSIEIMVETELPPTVSKPKCRDVFNRIKKLLPKPPRPPGDDGGGEDDGDPGVDPNFEITRLLKFDSRPARWIITLRMVGDGREISADLETKDLFFYVQFQQAVFEQTHVMLNDIKHWRWRVMLGIANPEVQEAPKEAKPAGAIESALEEFLADAKENPDIGLLKSFAGYDEEAQFFKYVAFKSFLKDERGCHYEDRVIYERLKALGFKTGPKRFGSKVERLWVKKFPAPSPDGPPPPPDAPPEAGPPGPPQEVVPVQEDLFDETTSFEGVSDETPGETR